MGKTITLFVDGNVFHKRIHKAGVARVTGNLMRLIFLACYCESKKTVWFAARTSIIASLSNLEHTEGSSSSGYLFIGSKSFVGCVASSLRTPPQGSTRRSGRDASSWRMYHSTLPSWGLTLLTPPTLSLAKANWGSMSVCWRPASPGVGCSGQMAWWCPEHCGGSIFFSAGCRLQSFIFRKVLDADFSSQSP